MSGRWIVIPKWDSTEEDKEGFQHYSDRDPKWIKVYRTLLSKDEFITMSFHLRGILASLWLEYAASNRQIRDSTLTLTRRLGQRVTTRDLEALNHAGFIEFSASAPLAPCYPRKEKIKNKKKPLSADAHNPKSGEQFLTDIVADTKGREHRPYDAPSNAAYSIRRQVENGVITSVVDLETELRALRVNGETATALRALLSEETHT